MKWYPRRVLMNAVSATGAASQAMSAPELPRPTISTRFSAKIDGAR